MSTCFSSVLFFNFLDNFPALPLVYCLSYTHSTLFVSCNSYQDAFYNGWKIWFWFWILYPSFKFLLILPWILLINFYNLILYYFISFYYLFINSPFDTMTPAQHLSVTFHSKYVNLDRKADEDWAVWADTGKNWVIHVLTAEGTFCVSDMKRPISMCLLHLLLVLIKYTEIGAKMESNDINIWGRYDCSFKKKTIWWPQSILYWARFWWEFWIHL